MIKDSGNRTEYTTGAVRDCKEGKGRCDLMPLDVLAGILRHDETHQPIYYIYEFQKTGNTVYLYHAIDSFLDTVDGGPCNFMLEIAIHFEDGARKYGENNWQKGIPIHSYIDSGVRHYLKHKGGWVDENHDRAFVWNIMCCIWTMVHHPELDDFTDKEDHVVCLYADNECFKTADIDTLSSAT